MKKAIFILLFITTSIYCFGQWQNNGTSLYYNTGKVGIGTDVPISLFELKGTHEIGYGMFHINSEDYAYMRLNSGSSIDYSGIYFATNNVNQMTIAWNPEDLAFNFQDATNSNAVRLSIEQSGNVGVGIKKPQYKLDVNGDINIPSGHNFMINGVALATGSIWNNNNNNISYNAGKVGIGTDAPMSLFELKGTHEIGYGMFHINSEDYAYMRLNSGSSIDYSGIYFATNNVNQMTIAWNPEDLAFNFQDATNSNAVRLSIEQSGNVGIGTGRNSLTEKLVVNGNVLIENNNALILTSPNGKEFKITVNDSGELTTTEVTTSNKTAEFNHKVTFFPNPVEDLLNITVNEIEHFNLDVEIYNMTGKMLFMKNYSSNNIQINTKDLKSGIYLIQLKDSKKGIIRSEKFIKQ